MRDVAIVGIGLTKFGNLWDKSIRDLAVEASLKAMEDAGVDYVDSIYIGNFTAGTLIEQEHLGSLIADYLGLTPSASMRVEDACASSAAALRAAFAEVASGLSETVLVLGVEKMTDVTTDGATYSLSLAADREYEGYQGITFPGLFALIAKRHMYEFGTTRRQLSLVAVKNHANALSNPNAQFHIKISPDDVEASPLVADPLRLLDCSPISDGAAALVLMPAERAKKRSSLPVKIAGIGQGSDTIALAQRESLVSFKATVKAAQEAYKMAGVEPQDIDVAEVHDCFTIAEICAIEDLGFFPKGEGGKAVEGGFTEIDGRIPVNPSGGLKAKGHPVGATGIAQVIEIVEQLRGEAEGRQVRGAKKGLTHNLGGSGGTVIVFILEAM